MVPGIRIFARGAGIPARIRRRPVSASPSSCTAPPTRGTRSRSFSAVCAPRVPRWCPIRVYRWKPTPLGGEFDQLVTGIARRQFDAVSFTSAPAAVAVLERSRELDIEDQLLDALRTNVHAMCVGPVTSRPLIRQGRADVVPRANAVGSLGPPYCRGVTAARVRAASGRRPRGRYPRNLCAGRRFGQDIVGVGHGDTARAGATARRRVSAAASCCGVLPGNGDDTHAVDTAVLRLRTALGDKNIVATVVKRGYRLAIDDHETRPGCRMSLILTAHGTRRSSGVAMIGDLAAQVSDTASTARFRWRSSTCWDPHPARCCRPARRAQSPQSWCLRSCLADITSAPICRPTSRPADIPMSPLHPRWGRARRSRGSSLSSWWNPAGIPAIR